MTSPTKTALLIIDVQKELFEKSIPIYQADRLLDNLGFLIDQAHKSGIPIFFIQHSTDKILVRGTAGWQLHARLQPQADDHLLEKHHGNAFEQTELENELEALQVKKLVIAGLVTHGCVKATALGALKLGYSVVLVSDGQSNFHKKAPEVIAEWNNKLSHAGVKLLATSEIVF